MWRIPGLIGGDVRREPSRYKNAATSILSLLPFTNNLLFCTYFPFFLLQLQKRQITLTMAPAGGVLAPVVMRLLRQAVVSSAKVSRAIQNKFSQPLAKEVEYVTVRASASARQPIHPAAILRQARRGARWSSTTSYSRLNTAVRRFITTASNAARAGPTLDRAAFTKTNVGPLFLISPEGPHSPTPSGPT